MGFLIVSLITSCLISFLISSLTSGCIFLIFFCGLTGSISVFAPLQFLGRECLKLFNVIFLEHCSHSTNSWTTVLRMPCQMRFRRGDYEHASSPYGCCTGPMKIGRWSSCYSKTLHFACQFLEQAFIWVGGGKNGKGAWWSALEYVMGSSAKGIRKQLHVGRNRRPAQNVPPGPPLPDDPGIGPQDQGPTRARFFAERASLQSTLLCTARFFAEHSPLHSTLLCRARSFAEHASLQSTLICRALSFGEHSPLQNTGSDLCGPEARSVNIYQHSKMRLKIQTGLQLLTYSKRECRARWCSSVSKNGREAPDPIALSAATDLLGLPPNTKKENHIILPLRCSASSRSKVPQDNIRLRVFFSSSTLCSVCTTVIKPSCKLFKLSL